MPERQYQTLTKSIVDRLAVNGKNGVFWDSELPGFGIRVYPSGRKVYVVQTRANGKSRRVTIGRHGDITLDQARKLLRDLGIEAVPHDFRSSFRDWAAECSKTPREVCEFTLAHVNSNRVEAA